MSFVLKTYQRNVLTAIDDFLSRARGAQTEEAVAAAFQDARRIAFGDSAPRSLYRPFSQAMPEVPVCCLRIPTGGGKTILAAHSISLAAQRYVGHAWPLTLWLVPSNTIRAQTLDALLRVGHPYREALEEHFPADRLLILDIAGCEQIRPEDVGAKAIIIVGTIQTLRVGNTASRDVYAHKEAFEPHFAPLGEVDFFERITEEDLADHSYLTPRSRGRVKYSFANLLAFYRPIVIVDEAHNAQTSLSNETLQRVRPACILEWTATPGADQNVLAAVSAQELKAEHMIKLPIVLKPHPNWQEAVRDAVLLRERLAEEARREEPVYVRPIVLFQADAKNGEVPVEALKTHLVDRLEIESRRIAVATGTQRELDQVNLFDRDCSIDFVITVEALKEGWDCSFAYVFATVQNIRSARDMEQLLGRVLRQPYATPLTSLHLNRAYAHVAAPATLDVANRLTDRLIAMGFEEYEAAAAVEPAGPDLFGDYPTGDAPRPQEPAVETTFPMTEAAADALAAAAPDAVKVSRDSGACVVQVSGILSPETIAAAIAAAPAADRETIERDLQHHQARVLKAASPLERGARLPPVPQLVVPVQGELVLFEPSVVVEIADFSLAGQPADLPGFEARQDAPGYLIDVERAQIRVATEYLSEQLDINLGQEGVRREDVIRTLDRRLQRSDLLQADMIAWIGRALDGLAARGIELTYVARHINDVADAMSARINALALQARRGAFQATLFGNAPRPQLASGFEFEFPNDNYPARFHYAGRYVFRKHFYGPPGELDSDVTQEETACAIAIDQLEEVEFWVRNLERRGAASFSLPTSTDAFYPDFVAFLADGRVLVVEYKGAVYYTNDDSREKRDIGGVWANASEGRCRFLMATAPGAAGGRTVEQQLRDAIA